MEHFFDAPSANILILAGIAFLAQAVFGRVGGLLGRLFGQIRPGARSRMLAGALGMALLIGGVKLHLLADARRGLSNETPKRASISALQPAISPILLLSFREGARPLPPA